MQYFKKEKPIYAPSWFAPYSSNRLHKLIHTKTGAIPQQYIRSWRMNKNMAYRPRPGFHPGLYAEKNNLNPLCTDAYVHDLKNNKPQGA